MFRCESLERLPFRVVVAWAAFAAAVGVILSIAESTPENLIHSVEAATFVFDLHSALGSTALTAGVVALAAAMPGHTRAHDVLRLLSAILPIVFVLPVFPDGARGPLASGVVALAAVAALVVTLRGLRERGFTPRNVGLGLAGLAQLGAAMLIFLEAPLGAALEHAVYVLVIGAIGALAEPAADEPPRVLTSAALVLLAAASYLPVGEDPTAPFALVVLFGQVVLGAVVVGAVFIGRAHRFPGAAARLAAVVAIVLVAHALLGRLFLAVIPDSSHLRDTYFMAALGHASWLALVTAILADWLRGREPRSGLRHVPTAGVVAAGAGALVLVWAYARLGSGGMPLGYLRYVELFTPGHVVAAIAATVWLLGMVTVVTTTRRMPPPAPVVTEVFA